MVRNCNVSIDILTTYIVLCILVFLNQDDDELHEETEEYLDGTQIAPKESLQGFGGWSARTRFAILSQQYPVFQLSFFLSATLLCINVDPEWILVQGCRAISAGCL
jgi:hypothetical protein